MVGAIDVGNLGLVNSTINRPLIVMNGQKPLHAWIFNNDAILEM